MHASDQVETIEEAIALFETVGMPARNLSARTRKEYRHDLADLAAFLAGQGIAQIHEVTLQPLVAYQAAMDARGYKPATRNRKTHVIKTFFNFLSQQGVLDANPAAQLVPPRLPKREPRFLSQTEYRRLLRACSHHPRDAAIIEVLLQTGMRLSELARLTIDDVEIPARITQDPENTGTVRVLRKGGRVMSLPLNHKACRALATYLKVRPAVAHRALFITKFGRPMGTRAIQRTVAKYLAEAGIKGATVHALRHTMATHHVAQGTDLKTIQETLGHASLATTTIYVGLAKQAQRKALQENAL